ncbi:hypothetical protein CFBP4996_09135 [Agrobacterium leguminum]|uniref:Uncharacterized protein n=1 Tax=Agrobacterium deltaense NCPPB 1641 TaxID=1183425 RepID=A0A1S7TIY7_9HYPH|nr:MULTISPECIES: hypothetical protein [Agrobacterium]WFS64711.1 hypothetical protein CFBP4996_09135 [Agrobacterium leguminum]CVI54565.1 conserved hypothetical protein [Agrobacterium deltaense NCPPB 1641]
MALPPHAQEWLERAEIDYIGPFVKAWAAFNAWYRHASGHSKERDMLNFAIRNNNSRLRRRVLPLLQNNNATAEAERLKQAICDLQLRLDAIQWEVSPKGSVERVSLREVCIAPKHLQQEQVERNGQRFTARKIAGGHIEITVVSLSTGNVRFQFVQERYDPATVYAEQGFIANLSSVQQLRLREFYDGCNPRPMVDLVQGSGPQLQVSTMQFQCAPEELLAGLVETLYAMRNALLHGEVDPDEQVLACFEPAYKIVTCFLRSIN